MDGPPVLIDETTIAAGRSFWFSRKSLLLGLAILLLLMSLLFTGLRRFENAITFHPVRYAQNTSWPIPAAADEVWFTTSDGVRLNGWLFQPPNKTPIASIIYFHGNGGNVTNVGWLGERLVQRGFAVLLFDYRGYGRSEGEIYDERDIYADADAAYDFMTASTTPESLVLYGQSLGTTAVADLASRRSCGSVIMESGLSSASDMAAKVLPWFPRSLHFLLRNRFDSARKLKNVRCPILITHGDPDPVIPTSQSRVLFANANEPKKLIIFPGAGHNVFGSLGDSYLDQISEFIDEAETSRLKLTK